MDHTEAKARSSTEGPLPDTNGAAEQETDLWWGSWSGWTMLPSMVVCLLLTGIVVWGAWALVERRFLQLTVWTLAGLIWLVQVCRWSSWLFGCNYRLTTRRLVIWRGHWPTVHVLIPLDALTQVRVAPYSHSRWTGIGRVIVGVKDREGDVVLEGIRSPEAIAALVTAAAARAAPRPAAATVQIH
jgi:hypothetical protein